MIQSIEGKTFLQERLVKKHCENSEKTWVNNEMT